MKKTIITISISALILFVLTGCIKSDYKEGDSNIDIPKNEVSLKINKNTLTNTGATFILINNSDTNILYGKEYYLEIKKDNKWHEINTDISFTQNMYKLGAKESVELDINWKLGYGELENGEYRIVKNIFKDKEDGYSEKINLTSEFIIK